MASKARTNRKRLLLAVAIAPLLVATLLLAGELLCRALTSADSPHAPPRWFVRRDVDGCAALVPSERTPFPAARFRPASIPIEKPPGVFRVLCLGDSTVHAHPFEPPAAFADWLAIRLPRLVEGFRFEVVNLGVNGLGSQAVADLARELAPLAPDAVIVYVGHNEYLDAWIEACTRPFSHRVRRLLERSWLGRRLATWLPARAPAQDFVAAARRKELVSDAPLLTEAELERGRRNFASHVLEIVQTIQAMDAIPVLCAPVSDIVDTPPQHSSFAASTPESARAGFREELGRLRARRIELDAGAQAGAESAAEAKALEELAHRLATVDTSVAALTYERGRLALRLGKVDQAHAFLLGARECDGHPIRMPGAMLEIVRDVARRTGAVLVDPWPLFEAAAPNGLPGQDGFFVDYVHPDLAGHRLIAEAILRALASRGAFAPAERWRFDGEPGAAEYESAMGLSRASQADSLARRGLFALGQSYLDPGQVEALQTAEKLFETALRVERDCALAHAGRGALALVRGESEPALAELERARELDPASLASLVEGFEKSEAVRALFERAGLTVREGRIQRR